MSPEGISPGSIVVRGSAVGTALVCGSNNVVTVIYGSEMLRGLSNELPQQGPPANAGEIGPNPYKGLNAFDETSSHLFFGREELTDKMILKLATCWQQSTLSPRLLAIMGPSGCGKSSIARAGLVPRLAKGDVPDLENATIAILRPGPHPIEALAVALARLATGDQAPASKAREFSDELVRAGADGRFNGLARLARMLCPPEAPLIILVDQFEETWTLCGPTDPNNRAASALALTERTAFVGALMQAATERNGQAIILLTLRSDFFGVTAEFPEINRAIADSNEIAPVMSRDELRAAIEEPAKVAGNPLHGGSVSRLLDEMEGQDSGLPLLQFALYQVWEGFRSGRAATETLDTLHGVGGALAFRAEELFRALPEERGRALVRRAFEEMVQLGEGARDTRRRARLADMVPHGATENEVAAALEPFVRERLISKGLDEQEQAVAELAHEALIQHWQRLEHWIDARRADLRFGRRVQQAATEWWDGGRPAGRLWRPPDLNLLQSYAQRCRQDLTERATEFLRRSEKAVNQEWWITRTAVGTIILLFLVASGTAYFAQSKRNEALVQRDIADQRRKTASARQIASESLVRTTSAPDAALLFALEAIATEDSIQARGNLMRVLDATSPVASYLHAPLPGVESTTFSPDGRLIAGIQGASLYVWSTATRNLAVPPLEDKSGITGSLFGAVFSPRGDSVASYGVGRAVLWDPTGHQIHTYAAQSGAVTSVAFHPLEHVLAIAGRDLLQVTEAGIDLWDTDSHRSIGRLEGVELSSFVRVAFNRDGRLLAATGAKGTIVVWEWKTREHPEVFTVGDDEIDGLAFSPRDDRLAYATKGTGVRVIDFANNSIASLPHNVHVTELAFSRDGGVLATGDEVGSVRFWNLSTYRPEPRVLQLGSSVTGLAFGSTTDDLVTSAHDSPVAFSRSGEGFLLERTACARGFEGSSIAYSEAAALVGVACSDGSISVFQLKVAPVLVHTIPPTGGHGGPIGFSPDGKRLVMLDCKGPRQRNCASELRVWSTDDWTEVAPRAPQEVGSPETLAVGVQTIAGGTFEADGNVYLWDAKDLHKLGVLTIGTQVEKVLFPPDESTIFVSTYDGTVAEWDVREEKPRRVPEHWHDRPVITLALSPAGTTLATGSGDRTIRLVDAQTFAPHGISMLGHDNSIFGLSFLDEETLASASYDGSVAVWDLKQRTMMGRLFRKLSPQKGLVFARKEQVLASFGGDGTLNVVPVSLGAWRLRACAAANRNLSAPEWTVAHPGESYRRTCPGFPTHPSVVEAALDLAREGDVERAVERLRAIVAQDPKIGIDPVAAAYKVGAEAAFRTAETATDVDLALANYRRGRVLSGGSQPDATVLNSLCWTGALHGRAAEVVDICDAAVDGATEQEKSLFRDSRAVARALQGDLTGAADDLAAFVATPGLDPKAVAIRSELLATLRQGRNPYDAQMLDKLRAE